MAHTLRGAVAMSLRSGRQVWVVSDGRSWRSLFAVRRVRGRKLVARVIGETVFRYKYFA